MSVDSFLAFTGMRRGKHCAHAARVRHKMNQTQIYSGKFAQKKKVFTDKNVKVFVAENCISIRRHMEIGIATEKLFVKPFSTLVFGLSSVKDGFELVSEGDDLGSFSFGPLGHPGDGEYDVFPIKRHKITGIYSQSGLVISIRAKTLKGHYFCHTAKEKTSPKYPETEIGVQFEVPFSKLTDFLPESEKTVKEIIRLSKENV